MMQFPDAAWLYILTAASAFLAATLLPFSSELGLIAAIKAGLGSTALLVAAATVGNVGGSVFNWWLGGAILRFQDRSWFPVSREAIAGATERFNHYGVWILLLSWLPIVGDPLTVVAGILKVRFWIFLPLVAVGRLGRYVVIAHFL
jgi:membrane protein YqaA with SNARE-associated domain